jgi:hypothetical protein
LLTSKELLIVPFIRTALAKGEYYIPHATATIATERYSQVKGSYLFIKPINEPFLITQSKSLLPRDFCTKCRCQFAEDYGLTVPPFFPNNYTEHILRNNLKR